MQCRSAELDNTLHCELVVLRAGGCAIQLNIECAAGREGHITRDSEEAGTVSRLDAAT